MSGSTTSRDGGSRPDPKHYPPVRLLVRYSPKDLLTESVEAATKFLIDLLQKVGVRNYGHQISHLLEIWI